MMSSDTGGGPGSPPRPEEDVERAKERLEAEREAAHTLAEDAQAAAGSLAARARSEALRQGEEVQRAAAGHLGHFAEAVRHAGDELAEKEPGPVSDLVRQAAHGLEQFSHSLAHRSPAEMVEAVRTFGRRNPVAFLAGSMLAGFALARFAAAPHPAEVGGARAYPTSGPATGARGDGGAGGPEVRPGGLGAGAVPAAPGGSSPGGSTSSSGPLGPGAGASGAIDPTTDDLEKGERP